MARQFGPDVVSDEGLRELVGQGHLVEVVCLEPAERRGDVWYGLWGIRSVAPDGGSARILVAWRHDKPRGVDRPRTFRTLNGLASFLRGLGFAVVSIPFEAGGEVRHTLGGPEARPD